MQRSLKKSEALIFFQSSLLLQTLLQGHVLKPETMKRNHRNDRNKTAVTTETAKTSETKQNY